MHISKWTKSTTDKKCTGCDMYVSAGMSYLHAKFTIDYPYGNVTKLISINLCDDCVKDFETLAKDPKDVVDNLNNEPI